MATVQTYDKCLQAMYELRRFGIKLGLDLSARILKELGDPQRQFACVHIAGSNGKGSIASMLATILQTAGLRVGLYTSPHLVRFNERIRIDGQPVSDADVVHAYEAVKKIPPGDRTPTFFEFTTAMALYLFARHRIEWAVIETGMGGRLDATNIVRPALSIISNISLEHQIYLGNTISQIAHEKGGIIKPGVPVVTGVKQPQARQVLVKIAAAKAAPFYRYGRDFRVRNNSDGTFSYFGIQNRWKGLKTALQGSFQTQNAALALAGCELLQAGGTPIPSTAIREGLQTNVWPGRLEVVSQSPLIIMDGAHNLAAARTLAGYLRRQITDKKIILVTGILDDKPYAAMLRALVPVCHRVVVTRPAIDRALAPEKLVAVVREMTTDVVVKPTVSEALSHALGDVSPEEVVCVAGSLYVVGEAKAYFENSTPFTV